MIWLAQKNNTTFSLLLILGGRSAAASIGHRGQDNQAEKCLEHDGRTSQTTASLQLHVFCGCKSVDQLSMCEPYEC